MQPIVAFDLDGTLVDTAPDLLAALDVVLSADGLPTLPRELGRGMIGHGAKAMIARGLRHFGETVTEARLEPMHDRFLAYYCNHIADSSRPFPGAVAALDRLEAAGVRLVVCTNKLEALSRQLLEALELAPRFAAIVGPDTLGVRKPDPAHVLGAIELGAGDPARAAMVGDSSLDVTAAQRAGVPVVAVDFGYPEKPVQELGADVVIGHYDMLWGAVAPHLGLASSDPAPAGPPCA